MTLAMVFKLLLVGSVFLIVFALALRARTSDALYLFTHPGPALRALAAIFVVVPIVAVVIAAAFNLHVPVKIALLTLALSPLPPVLPAKQLKAGATFNYTTGLLFASALASIVIAPLGWLLIDWFVPGNISLSAMAIVPSILITTALPLILGVIARRLLGDKRADKMAGPINKIATIILVVMFLVLVVHQAPAMWQLVGDGTLAALGAMIVAGIAAGYWLAGDDPGDKAALALAASTRHPGVAIAIATATFPGETLASAAILLGALLSLIIAIPFLKRIGSAGSSAK